MFSTENPLPLCELTSVTSVDGRYGGRTCALRHYFSEYSLIRHRIEVEIEWLIHLSKTPQVSEIPEFDLDTIHQLRSIIKNFNLEAAQRVKTIERDTNHDLKAVEYYIKENMHSNLQKYKEFVHFGCTSEDINNTSYALMCQRATTQIIIPKLQQVVDKLVQLAKQHANIPLLSRTHGQPASPTTFGKEFANFANRLQYTITKRINAASFKAKLNGAVGNFNALQVTHPNVDWETNAKEFIENALGLSYQKYSTQIEPHDDLAFLLEGIAHVCNIMINLSTDMWTYISRDLLKLATIANEVGSSTMPHKVNPIDFENCEGNAGLAIATCRHLSDKLVKSRLQRDLSDSSALRALGSCFGYTIVACDSMLRGLGKISPNVEEAAAELERNIAVLAEPIQMVFRKESIETPYEKLKELTRGKDVTEETFKQFIESQGGALSEEARKSLLALTPGKYTGIAAKLALDVEECVAELRRGVD